MNANSYDSNKQFDFATQFVLYTKQSLFVTGKAGTGKTTFLKHLRNHSLKNMVVTAPTGVAAINAGGSTLHSFFQLPLKPFLPTRINSIQNSEQGFCDQLSLFSESHHSSERIEVYRKMEILIIDEVSMVRADTMDAIDLILRKHRAIDEPFGGVQLILIGDLYQLPPVVKQETWPILNSYYKNPYFFESQAIKKLNPEIIELTRIYRQSDDTFINILNRIRTNLITDEDLKYLHSFMKPSFRPGAEETYITLTSHNEKSEATNRYQLRQLNGNEKVYKATIEDDFPEKSFPTEINLHLKTGAQVMFIRNDKGEERKFFNGMLARVTALEDDFIMVRPAGSETDLKVLPETWKNVRYGLNKELNEVEEHVLGTFTQFPLRLAWAITIHKSQGLTFERAIIDAGDSFAPGQVYVALSRLTSTKELVLKSSITKEGIMVDPCINRYLEKVKGESELSGLLHKRKLDFLTRDIIAPFEFKTLNTAFQQHRTELLGRSALVINLADIYLPSCFEIIEELELVATKFEVQLAQLRSLTGENRNLLLNKIIKGSAYFSSKTDRIKQMLEDLFQKATQLKGSISYQKSLNSLISEVNFKRLKLTQSGLLAKGYFDGKQTESLIENMRKQETNFSISQRKEKRTRKPVKGETRLISLKMFQEGKGIETIAQERGLVKGTIESHLISFIREGKISVFDFVSQEEFAAIEKKLEELVANPEKTMKEMIDEKITYGKMMAVKEYRKMQETA